MKLANNNYFVPLEVKKETKIYALYRVLFNIPNNILINDNIPAYNFIFSWPCYIRKI